MWPSNTSSLYFCLSVCLTVTLFYVLVSIHSFSIPFHHILSVYLYRSRTAWSDQNNYNKVCFPFVLFNYSCDFCSPLFPQSIYPPARCYREWNFDELCKRERERDRGRCIYNIYIYASDWLRSERHLKIWISNDFCRLKKKLLDIIHWIWIQSFVADWK